MEVQVMTNVLAKNDAIAETLQEQFKDKHILVMNLLGSPGAGKTSLLEATLQTLSKDYRIAVIEGDLFTDKDAERIHATGVPVIQINTVGEAIAELDLDALDLIIIENVGNLVCPAEFFIGEDMKVTVLSITEGEDKPLKYPLIFKESSAVLLNKVDLLPYVPFKMDEAIRDIQSLQPGVPIFQVSCTQAEGLSPWITWVKEKLEERRNNES